MALARHSTSQAIDNNVVVYANAYQRRIMRHLPLLLLADLNSLPILVDFKYGINANPLELHCIELKNHQKSPRILHFPKGVLFVYTVMVRRRL